MWGGVDRVATPTVVTQCGWTWWWCKVSGALGLHVVGLSVGSAAIRVFAPYASYSVQRVLSGRGGRLERRRHVAPGGHARACRGRRLELGRAVCAEGGGAWVGRLCAECGGDDGVQVVHVEGVFAQELAAAGGMALLVAGAEVLADKGAGKSVQARETGGGGRVVPMGVGEVAVGDLVGVGCSRSGAGGRGVGGALGADV